MKQKRKKKEVQVLRQKASLTVECAVILPLFFFAMVVLASLIDLYRTTTMLQSSLCESAKELGMYAYCQEEGQSPVGVVENGVCQIYAKRKIKENFRNENLIGIVGGVQGINLMQSSYENGMISLKASFLYQTPFVLFQNFPVRIQIQGQARAWIGYTPKEEVIQTEEMVYITDWESVYHTDASCTHLQLSIQSMPYAEAEQRKNIYNEKYHRCERCMKTGEKPGIVYVTPMGNRYHKDKECGGLKRHVKMIKKSQANHLKKCERCGG